MITPSFTCILFPWMFWDEVSLIGTIVLVLLALVLQFCSWVWINKNDPVTYFLQWVHWICLIVAAVIIVTKKPHFTKNPILDPKKKLTLYQNPILDPKIAAKNKLTLSYLKRKDLQLKFLNFELWESILPKIFLVLLALDLPHPYFLQKNNKKSFSSFYFNRMKYILLYFIQKHVWEYFIILKKECLCNLP